MNTSIEHCYCTSCRERTQHVVVLVRKESAFAGKPNQKRHEFISGLVKGWFLGGFIAAMMDEAMSTCCIIASNVTMTAPTLEMKTSYLRRLMPGKAAVEAHILKWGRSAAFMEAECFDDQGKLVAKATATAIPMPFKRLS